MPLTWTKAIETFKHIMSNVFEVPEDGSFSKAVESAGYDDIWTLATLLDKDIEALTFDEENKKDVPLGRTHRSQLCIFLPLL